jgi:hypothetical protein
MKRSNNRRMEIRPLVDVDVDVDAVIRVWIETKRDTYDFIEIEQTDSEADDHAFFRAQILPRCAIWIAAADGDVLGSVVLDHKARVLREDGIRRGALRTEPAAREPPRLLNWGRS